MIFNYYEENLSIEEMTKILNTEVDVIFTYCNYTNSILEFYAYRKDKLIIDVRNKYDDGVSDKKKYHMILR